MSAAYAHPTWPSSPGSTRALPWVFGREIVIGGLPGAPNALQWLQKRNCSMTPLQLGQVYMSLCLVSMLIGGFFFFQGAPFVLIFTGLELLAVGVAMLLFARHASDRETLTLVGRQLLVEQCIGPRVQCTEFAADWLSVEPAAGQGSLVELKGRGQQARVGRFLRPELRGAFARELRHALRRPATSMPHADPSSEPDPNPGKLL